jgi:AP-1 complex subunit beta-1
LESLDEPNAKAAMIWIIGEYAQRIDNSRELIEYFLETFKTETHQVQLQLLTATVKLFLKKPKEAQTIVQQILQTTTSTGESADLRDKAYIYWRLLSYNPQYAKVSHFPESCEQIMFFLKCLGSCVGRKSAVRR